MISLKYEIIKTQCCLKACNCTHYANNYYFLFCSQYFPYTERFYLCKCVSHSPLNVFIEDSPYFSIIPTPHSLYYCLFHRSSLVFFQCLNSTCCFQKTFSSFAKPCLYCLASAVTVLNHFTKLSDGCIKLCTIFYLFPWILFPRYVANPVLMITNTSWQSNSCLYVFLPERKTRFHIE